MTRITICAVLATLCYASFATGADYNISTQADFDNYREATFSPGDRILLERGKAFTGMLAPRGNGTPGNVITISAYGSGDKPAIHNNGMLHPHPVRSGAEVSAAILLFNAEYWEVNNIEVTNNNGGDQAESLMGIYVLAEDTGAIHDHIYIEDCYVHHVNGDVAGKKRGGIHVHGYAEATGNTASYNDVRIVNNRVEFVGGVGIGTDGDNIEKANLHTGAGRANAHTNFYVAHNYVGNTGRNNIIARDLDFALYEYNTLANSSRFSTGHSIYNFNTLDIIVQYNEAYGNVGVAGESDRGGFDADYNSRGTIIQYNYSHDNHWFCGIMKKPNIDVTIRYNLSVNERYGAYMYGFESASDLADVKIYNNTHYFKSGISPDMLPKDRTPLSTTFNNNIFYCAGSGSMGSNANSGDNVIYDTNVYYNITPPASENNALTVDPLFVSPGDEPYDVDMENNRSVLDGYRLAFGSPVIDAGLTISNDGGRDFWGEPVPIGSTDVGASEDQPVTAPGPDLCGREFDFWPEDVNGGDPIHFVGRVTNEGWEATIGGFWVEFRVWPDARFEPTGPYLCDSWRVTQTLDPGESVDLAPLSRTINTLAPGAYTVGIVVDPLDEVVEVSENNNVTWVLRHVRTLYVGPRPSRAAHWMLYQ